MPDYSQYLSIIRYSPRFGWDTNVPLSGEIKVWFNIPINVTSISSAVGINQQVILTRMDTDEYVNVLFGGWDSTTKILTILPSGNLIAGEIYQVTIRKDIQASTGRRMLADFHWTFEVSAAPMSKVVLNSPGDATAHSAPPSLIFNGVWIPSGFVTYEVQVDEDWRFNSLSLWSTTFTTSGSGGIHAVNIGTTLSVRKAYYWRARAYSGATTGDWSDTRSFWLGTPQQISPDVDLLYHPSITFAVDRFLPENGTSNQLDWPIIQATFTDSVSSATITSSNFYVLEEPVDGRGGGTSGRVVSGDRSVIINSIVFTPTEPIKRNTRYTVFLSRGIYSTGNVHLEDVVTTYFSGKYVPFYGGTIGVRSELGGFIDNISDDEIHFTLWRSSITVNEKVYTKLHQSLVNVSLDEVINYVPSEITYGMVRYTELDAAISLLDGYYYEVLSSAGRRRQLSVFSHEVDTKLLEEIRAKINELTKARDEIAAYYLIDIVIPRTTIKSKFWSKCGPHGVDWSYRPRKEF